MSDPERAMRAFNAFVIFRLGLVALLVVVALWALVKALRTFAG